jgi:uncharacterized phage protein (TIGR02218 family)
MTIYDDYDRSLDSGRPAELFQFTGGVQAYFTTKQRAISYGGFQYLPDYILHQEIEQSEELNKQELEITLRSSTPLAQYYIVDVPPLSVNVRVYRFIDGVNDYRLVWVGRVVKATFDSQKDECTLTCEPVYTLLKRPGLRRNYQILCPYSLYDSNCGILVAPYTINDRVTSVSGATIGGTGIAAKTNGYYVGGMLRFGSYLKLIINHASNKITVSSPIPGLQIGSVIDVSAGCNKSVEICASKFNNVLNFGGFPYIPTKNPFSGDSLYS